jgi:alkanesulfonate monooxygenase SsuD/methylene tetrahydromethanopterin reductase-like flavin-dependent oxidoreductase (luciferase family)
MKLGLGIAAGPDPEGFTRLAAEAERLGYTTLFSNDSPAGEGLAMLSSWAKASQRIDLGVGVLALDRHQPADVAARVAALGLPHGRLVLGVGSGFSEQPLGAMREGVAAIRALLPDVRVIVAAMGPKMCALAGEVGDGALLNWMTPERALWARELVLDGAKQAGRDPLGITIYGYIRVALGKGAAERLKQEASFYTQMPHYARHFEATGVPPGSIGIAAAAAADLREQLRHYAALDIGVARILSHRQVDAILEVATAAIG